MNVEAAQIGETRKAKLAALLERQGNVPESGDAYYNRQAERCNMLGVSKAA